MARAGFSFEKPVDAIGAEWPEPRPGEAERQTAEADAGCRDDVGFIATIVAVEGEYQQEALDAQSTALEEARQRRDALQAEARQAYETAS